MAACGGIEHIFEKPLPESPNILEALSPLKHKNIDGEYRHKKSLSSDSLSLCTEGLGFESFDDAEETSSHDDLCCIDGERNVRRSERGEASKAAFPPPISSRVWFKSCREDGRFILKQVRIPTQEFLLACRQHGRLQLHFQAHHQQHVDLNQP